MEGADDEADGLAHPPHLPIAAFMDSHVERRALAMRPRQPDVGRAAPYARLQHDSGPHARELT